MLRVRPSRLRCAVASFGEAVASGGVPSTMTRPQTFRLRAYAWKKSNRARSPVESVIPVASQTGRVGQPESLDHGPAHTGVGEVRVPVSHASTLPVSS